MHFFPFDFLSANELALDIFGFDHKLDGLHQIAIACIADVEAKTCEHACESHEAGASSSPVAVFAHYSERFCEIEHGVSHLLLIAEGSASLG